MRISDWSSDVCSSDLRSTRRAGRSRFEACDEIERAGSFQGERIRIVRVVSAWPGMTARREGENDAGRRLRMRGDRSEEHTSELQSLMRISYAVFCLNKKKHTLVIVD